MASGRQGATSAAAALLALLLLSFASVQSVVMRTTMPASDGVMRICGEGRPGAMGSMSGMGMGRSADAGRLGRRRPDPVQKRHEACPYCAAAAHAPIIGYTTPLRPTAGFVYTALRAVAVRGPRGPPEHQPRARGPPEPLPIT